MATVYDKISKAEPNFAETIEKVKSHSESKLFHQLVTSAFPILSSLKDGALAIELFEKDIKPIGEKLNPVMYMEIIGILLKKFMKAKSCDDKLTFISENFAPFDVEPDEEEETSKDKDGDVKMGDGSSGSKDGSSGSKDNAKKTPATTTGSKFKNGQVGKLSHYSKASESDFKDAKALFLSFKAQILVEHAKTEDAKDVMDNLESQLFKKRTVVSIVPKVFSWFYAAQLRLYHATQKSSEYYRAGVNYLLYTPLEQAAEEFDVKELAVNLGIAALIAPGEYNFGELLDLGLYKDIPEVKSVWIYDLIYAFQEGKYELYDKATKKHAADISKIKILEEKKADIYEKFCSSVLMEFAFQQPKNKRTIDLKLLAHVIRVDDVETLLINAMCANLIKGTIDEVSGTFTYTWVKPRVLDVGRLKTLEERVGGWMDQQKTVLMQVEELIPELAVTA